MKHYISKSYTLKWQFKDCPQYCISSRKKIINIQTGQFLKRCLNGGSIGYWIQGKWVAEKNINNLLKPMDIDKCPF